MSFIFEGVLIKKELPKGAKDRLVADTYKKFDKRTGRHDLYRRVSYYDPQKRFNVPVGSKKIGEIDPETGKVTEIIRRQSPVRKTIAEAILEIADKAEKQLDDQRQQAKVIYSLPVALDVLILAALGNCNGSKQMAEYWKNNQTALQERWGIDFPKTAPSVAVALDVLILAALGNCNGSKQMAEYWKNNQTALQERWGIDFPKTAPSVATLHRILQLIDPEQLQNLYQEFVFALLPNPSQRNKDKDIVAIDGQAIRASRTEVNRQHQMLSFYSTETGIAFCQIRIDTKSNEKPAALELGQAIRASRTEVNRQHQMLSFYSTETGIAFCQIRIDTKSNEKPAALELAKRLDLAGTIVTGDAMHCERKLLETLMKTSRADYCMALKMNQGKTTEEVKALFEKHQAETLTGTQKDSGHGRKEIRTTYVLPGNLLSQNTLKRWYGLEFGCIVKQVSQRTVLQTKATKDASINNNENTEATTTQTRYYLTSLSPHCPDIVRNVQRAVRNHWGIENSLHHVLDVDFGQDAMQAKNVLTSLSPHCPDIVRNVQRAVRNHWGIENSLHHVLDVDFGQDAMQAKNVNYVTNMTQLNKMALAVIELVKRRKIKSGEMTARTAISTILRSLHNNPRLAGEYLDIFVRESALAAASRTEEPLIK